MLRAIAVHTHSSTLTAPRGRLSGDQQLSLTAAWKPSSPQPDRCLPLMINFPHLDNKPTTYKWDKYKTCTKPLFKPQYITGAGMPLEPYKIIQTSAGAYTAGSPSVNLSFLTCMKGQQESNDKSSITLSYQNTKLWVNKLSNYTF